MKTLFYLILSLSIIFNSFCDENINQELLDNNQQNKGDFSTNKNEESLTNNSSDINLDSDELMYLNKQIEALLDEELENEDKNNDSKYKNLQNEIYDKLLENKKDIDRSHHKTKGSKYTEYDDQEFLDEQEDITDFEREISEFKPHDILTIVLNPKVTHNFYLNITHVPSTIKASFFVVDESQYIDYLVTIPTTEIKHNLKNENHDFLILEAQTVGLYTFSLKNTKKKESVKVTFAVNAENNVDEFIKNDHITNLKNSLVKINEKANNLENLKKHWNMKFVQHLDKANTHNRSIITFSLIECGVLILIFYFQLKYMVSLVDKL